jgi:hypothetical protein
MADSINNEKIGKVSDDSGGYDGRTEIENASRSNSAEKDLRPLDTDQLRHNINAKIANPLAGFSHNELAKMGEAYVREHTIGDEEDIRAFRLGALIAQDPFRFAEVAGLSIEEKAVLDKELTHKWSQPKLLYLVIILCSTCAAVQGMGKL